MALTTYAELQTSIANWLHRADLTSVIPDFITLAEVSINRDLRVPSMITEATVNPSQSVKYVAFPTGLIEPISFVDDQGEEINQVHIDELKDMAYQSSAGRPEYWSKTSRIDFERVADASYDFVMTYYKELDLASDLTNAVLTDYPDIYLYGSLAAAEKYIQNDPRVGDWITLYQQAVKRANNRSQQNLRTLRTDFPLLGGTYNINRGY